MDMIGITEDIPQPKEEIDEKPKKKVENEEVEYRKVEYEEVEYEEVDEYSSNVDYETHPHYQ